MASQAEQYLDALVSLEMAAICARLAAQTFPAGALTMMRRQLDNMVGVDMALTTETIKLWRNNAGITAGETAEDDPEHIAAKAILALADEILAIREMPPAPAVPEEIVNNSQAKALLRELFGDEPVDSAEVATAVWNACRAAMLEEGKS